jgi:hypothetical protein
MDVKRARQAKSLERSGRLLTAGSLFGIGIAVVAAAAVAAFAVFGGIGMFSESSDVTSVQAPDLFAERYPVELNAALLAAERDKHLQRAKAQLTADLRSLAPQTPPEEPTIAAVAGPRVPIPKPRPVVVGLMANYGAAADAKQVQTSGPFDVSAAIRNVFAMLPPGLRLASANPDGGVKGDGQDPAPDLTALGKQTALYDISARTVYMPDGSRLEAHSGLGDLMDDVRFVHVRDRGPTPPNVYELSFREKPFHGVTALRMKPVGDGDLFGRDGLLTHSYLIGPNGESNGCVSFKDYDAFLKAFSNGDVKRLVVVKSVRDEAVKVARRS